MILRRSAIAAQLLLLAAISAFFVSGALLNNLGFNYSTVGRSGGLKVHPYTLFTVLAVVVMVGGRSALARCLRSRQFCISMTGAGITLVMLIVKSATGDGQSLGFGVDTLVAAFLVAAVLPFIPARTTARLSTLALGFLFVECGLAMIEAMTRWNLIPVDVWYGAYFRATSLQGHPLNNALIVVTMATTLQVEASRWRSLAIFTITFGALVAFGARGALGLYILVNGFAFIRFGMRSTDHLVLVVAGGFVGVVAFSWLLLSGLLGDRLAQVGAFDDSSEVRVQSLQILMKLDWTQLLFGSGAIQIVRLMDEARVGVIENFLVGYLLMFGAVLTTILLVCIYRTCKVLFDGIHGRGMAQLLVVAFVFVGTALTNNSLITKTPVLYLLMIGLWCAASRLRIANGVPSTADGVSLSSQVPGLSHDAIRSLKQ